MKLGFLASLATLLAVVAMIENVEAQPYPSRPIKLVVPYGPGGAGDVIARIVSEQLAKDLGVSVVVENKPGAGGMIGAQAVASARPDGYTVLVGNTTEMVVGPHAE
jgi:tripartite-type tricarboxylate transporter receptor subunit TctC